MAVKDEHVLSGFLTPVLTQLFFPKPPNTFLTCFRGERRNTPERKLASSGYRTHNPQVMSQTDSLLSHPVRLENAQRFVKYYEFDRWHYVTENVYFFPLFYLSIGWNSHAHTQEKKRQLCEKKKPNTRWEG